MDDRVYEGRVLAGKWRLDELLGEGGMATVWAATHRNGRRAAIKILHAHLSNDPALRERFQREGYVANRVDHRGVTAVLDDAMTEDGLVLLIMDLLEGQTLKAHWNDAGRTLPAAEVVAIGRAVLDILAAAHESDVVHRDVKPDNLFLTTAGEVKLLDFGIARLREEAHGHTSTGVTLGTPAFMPPEQALGHRDRVGPASDIFAVGAMMWTLLTGQLVHVATTRQELLIAAGTAPARRLRSVAPAIDAALAAAIDKALAFAPSDRWQTAAEMSAALPELDALAVASAKPSVDRISGGTPSAPPLVTNPSPMGLAPMTTASSSAATLTATPTPRGERKMWAGASAILVVVGAWLGWRVRSPVAADVSLAQANRMYVSETRLMAAPTPAEPPRSSARPNASAVPRSVPTTARAAPRRQSSPGSGAFDPVAAQWAVDRAARSARVCPGLTGTKATASVRWNNDGSVAAVTVSALPRAQGFAACVKGIMRQAAIAEFSGDTGTTGVTVVKP